MTRIALILNGAIMTIIGLNALIRPEAFLGQYGVQLPSAMALAEARSIHGGGFLAMAILMWLGLARRRFRVIAVGAAAFMMTGMALGRLFGVVAGGATAPLTLIATFAEALLGGVAFAGLAREKATG